MKFVLQKILNIFGYKVTSVNNKIVKDFDQTIKKIFNKKKLKIIDIGANTGQTIDRFQRIFSNCEIYSIEPSLNAFSKLNRDYKEKKNISLFNFAIGDKKKNKVFYDYNDNILSSFNKLNKKNSLNNKYKKNKVKVLSLDEFCKQYKISNVNILKIDTQGNEINILRSGIKSLRSQKFDLIELEIILGNYYNNFTNFFSLEEFLIKNNYRLFALDRRLNFFNDERMYCNAIYIKKSLYNKIKS